MHPAPSLWAKHATPPTSPGEGTAAQRQQGSGVGDEGIRCPRCRWRPRRSDRWSCRCGHAWNTFETRGQCPRCEYRWRNTQCLRCREFSPHEDWYAGRQDAQ